MEQHEEWKQYEPFPCYWVSDLGRVKRMYKNGIENYLNLGADKTTGYIYIYISLARKPKPKRVRVHNMVASCFIHNPEDKLCVDHINGNKLDNRVSNLRWATSSENQRNITQLQTNNKSRCTGVESKKYKGLHWKWCSRITVNKERIHLGFFDNYDDAVKARREAEQTYFGDFCPNRD